MKVISLSISADSIDFLLDAFNSTVENVIDDISPMKVCKKNGRQKSPWRKSTAVQSMKRQCRKAERMWRKTKLEIPYSIYKDSLHAFNIELATSHKQWLKQHSHSFWFPVKCSLTANAMSLLPSFLRRSIISERRLAYLLVMQRSHRFDRKFKNKYL